MKNIYLFFASFIFSASLIAQTIVTVAPCQVVLNQTFSLIVHANKTNFLSADSNIVILANQSDTITVKAYSTYYENEVSIPYNNTLTSPGFYDMYIINNIDDTIKKENAFFVSNAYNNYEINPYNHNNNQSTFVKIKNILASFFPNSNISAVFVNMDNDSIHIDSLKLDSFNDLVLYFKSNSNQHGMYNLMLYNDNDSISYRYNAINILNSNFTQIDSLSPDTLHNWSMTPAITLYGHNTHFTHDSNSVIIDQEFAFRVFNINAINDSVLNCNVEIPIACKKGTVLPVLIYGTIYNPIDSFMGFSFNVFLYGGINSSKEQQSVELFPNPLVDSKVTLKFQERLKQSKSISVFNSSGKLVFKRELIKGSQYHILDIPNLDKGVYFYNIPDTKGGKFIVL